MSFKEVIVLVEIKHKNRKVLTGTRWDTPLFEEMARRGTSARQKRKERRQALATKRKPSNGCHKNGHVDE